jgi:hypothetical protein
MLTRAWYHCVACGHGLAPRDAGPGVAGASLSPGLAAMNGKAAAGPFARAAGLAEDLAGVRLTVRRAERAAGASGAAQAAAARERATMITARKLPGTALGYPENNAPRMRWHWFRSRGLLAAPGWPGPAARRSPASASNSPACAGPSPAPAPSPPCAASRPAAPKTGSVTHCTTRRPPPDKANPLNDLGHRRN